MMKQTLDNPENLQNIASNSFVKMQPLLKATNSKKTKNKYQLIIIMDANLSG